MLNCATCPSHCCGRNQKIGAPILLPQEIETFEYYCHKAELVDGIQFYRLNRTPEGNCVFLDKNNKCKGYSFRPYECIAYPYILRVDGFDLHPECPQYRRVVDNEPIRPNVDPAWLAAYDKLPITSS
jgi:Fe-S-cluster containining protein